MDIEIKSLFEEQAKTLEEFRAANDKLEADIKKMGSADALQTEKVEKLNARLDELQGKIAARVDEVEKRMNRLRVGGNGGPALDEEVKSAGVMARMLGLPQMEVDEYRGYKSAWEASLRRGQRMTADEVKALSVGSDPDGGYLVPADVSGRIITMVYETSPMRQLASVDTIGTDRLQGPVDTGEFSAGWVSESQPRPATATSKVGQWEIRVHEMYAYPETTQMLLDDGAFDAEGWISRKVAEKFTRTENTAFFMGDGDGKPRGILNYPRSTAADGARAASTYQYIASGTNGSLGTAAAASDKLIDLVYAIKAAYRANASWCMSRGLVAAVRKIKDGQGNYAWQPSLQALQAGTLLGFPIVEAEDMPDLASNGAVIGFGDFRASYQIVDRIGIRTLRDPYSNKPYVGFYTTRRVGGGALNFESVKFLQASAT